MFTLAGGCASVESARSHYMLKACSIQGCNIVNLFDSLSYCMDVRDQLKANNKELGVICEGFKEP
jgi:hypothetical protein